MAGSTDIDKLSIKIDSSSKGAVDQIDTLVKKLGSLTRALEKATVDPSIASGLDLVAKSARKFNANFGKIDAQHIKDVGVSFQTLASGINNVNKAINGVDFMKLANQASQLDAALDKKLNETLDMFGIKGTKNINMVKEAFYDMMTSLKAGNIESAISSGATQKAVQALRDNARFVAEPSNDVIEAQRLINAVKRAGTGGVGIDSNLSSEVADIKGTMEKYANVFTTSGNAKQGINDFIRQNDLAVQIGLNEAKTFEDLAVAINRAVAVLNEAKNSTIGYDQAVKQLRMDENYAQQAVAELISVYDRETVTQEKATQAQRQNAESMQSVSGLYKQFAQGLREVASVEIPEGRATSISNLAHAISQFGYAKVETATQIIPALTREINNMLTVLSKSPDVSRNITRLINALAMLTANGQTLRVATNAIANGMNKTGNSARRATPRVTMFGNALKSIHGQSLSVIGSLRRLAGVFGTVYASLFMFVGAFHKLKEAIGYAADLTEIQNVVDVTFGNAADKVDEFTKTSIRDFGINELSVKQFASRYQSMGVAMGITNEQVKNAHEYLSQFRTPTGAINGYNELSDSMADMSLNLTKLTGDLASFYDQDQADVAQALQSGIFAGQTRPLRQYGVDLTQATLQEWALSQGINANIASMTQAEKTMLRYEYTMQRLGMAQGDFVRTQHTWANQVRVLKQQFQALGAVIGQGLIQALKPALIAMNAFLSKVIEFATKVLNALGKIFGWKVDISAGALDDSLDGAEEAASGLGDALGEAGDAADGAADSVKELNKQVQGFDKLNILTTSETGGSKGSGGNGSGSGSGSDSDSGVIGSANDLAVNLKKTEGLFKSNINNLRELGTYIGNSLKDAMDGIDWDSIYEKARGFGTGLAQFLNGLFSGSAKSNVFASLGRTVAGAINTALNFFDSFADEFDFSTFGRNLASFFVETVANIDWTMAGSAFHKWMQGIKNAFKEFVKYLWQNKDEVWQAIKSFFSEVTFEDIAILIGIITIKKIGSWVLAGGVMDLASKAISALFTKVAISIGVKITGLTAAEVASMGVGGVLTEMGLFGANGLIANALGLALLEGTGAATIGGALATFALPIAFAIVPLIVHKILRNMYEDAKEEGDTVKQEIIENAFGKKASISRRRTADGDVYDVELGAVINWKLLFGKITDNLPWKGQGFFKWLGSKMFPETVKVNGKDVEINYGGGVGFGLGDGGINFPWKGTGFFRWLAEKLFPRIVSINGNDVEIDYSGGIGFKLGDGKKFEFPWKDKGFFRWLAEKLFPKTIKTTDGQNLEMDYSIGLNFNLSDKIKDFKSWLKEALGIEDGKDDATAQIGRKKNWVDSFKKWLSGNEQGDLGTKATAQIGRKHNWGNVSYSRWLTGNESGDLGTRANVQIGRQRNWGNTSYSYWLAGNNRGDLGTQATVEIGRTPNWSTSWSYWLTGNASGLIYNAATAVINRVLGKAGGGILGVNGWKPIQGYASGGFVKGSQVSSAEIFMARENGLPEMVGTIGGHTAVMNNDQIVASVANGVAQANAQQNELLRTQNALLRQILAKETGISSRDLFNAVRSENQNYINRTGKPAFS